jgi:hypothetical protein
VIEPKVWETRLHKASILNLFNIPHFGRSNEVNAYIKMLPSCVHGGYLWLNRLVSIDTDFIVCIIGLPSHEEDPTLLFFDKKNEKTLSKSMREMFHTHREQRGLDVTGICDLKIRFVTQVLACKLLRKCIKYQVPTTVIVVTEKCVEGVQMNWVMFLVN